MDSDRKHLSLACGCKPLGEFLSSLQCQGQDRLDSFFMADLFLIHLSSKGIVFVLQIYAGEQYYISHHRQAWDIPTCPLGLYSCQWKVPVSRGQQTLQDKSELCLFTYLVLLNFWSLWTYYFHSISGRLIGVLKYMCLTQHFSSFSW